MSKFIENVHTSWLRRPLAPVGVRSGGGRGGRGGRGAQQRVQLLRAARCKLLQLITVRY